MHGSSTDRACTITTTLFKRNRPDIFCVLEHGGYHRVLAFGIVYYPLHGYVFTSDFVYHDHNELRALLS
jgi:hypothetical protein